MNDSQTLDLEKIWKKNLFVIWLSQFLAMVGFGCCMPFIPLLLRENLHISDDSVRGMYVSIYYLAGMLSLCAANAIWGMLADRFGRKIMLLRASFGAAFIYPLLAFAPNFWVLVLIRFVCSFLSGWIIWGVYAPEGQAPWLYSLVYNGGYMLPNTVLCAAVTVLLCFFVSPVNLRPMRKK